MHNLVSYVCSLAGLISLAAGASIPRHFERAPVTRPNLNSNQVQRELGGRVSKATTIYGPTDDRYDQATARWNTFAVPQIQVVIEPGEESDVAKIVSRHTQELHHFHLLKTKGQIL